MSVPQVVIASCVATAVVGGLGLLMMVVGEDVAWGLCVGTVVVLLAATVILKRIDVRRSVASTTPSAVEGGTRAA
jgi:UDP-GlcNAc:undecaprenyl-phosphate GlcNAc-1-phosphate transferase